MSKIKNLLMCKLCHKVVSYESLLIIVKGGFSHVKCYSLSMVKEGCSLARATFVVLRKPGDN